ncbi:MAG: hypothetical protein L0Z50_38940 [Verrucomicrobiales bacterium]|nr:hypothetical protein [Verrucomicrobiales bacterium]
MKRQVTIIGSALGALGTLGAIAWMLVKRAADRAQRELDEMRFLQHELAVLESEGGIVLR